MTEETPAADATRPPRQEQETASEEVTEVAPGILRMQLPISLPGLGHVNTYALCDARGVAVVDPGLPGEESWNALVSRLDAAGYRPEHVHTVIVTHSHPDHFGGAGILRAEAGSDVLTHRAFRTWLDPDEGDDAGPDELPAEMTEEEHEAVAERRMREWHDKPWDRQKPWGGGNYEPPNPDKIGLTPPDESRQRWMMAPQPNRRVDDADVVAFADREWVAMHTPGHTQDHLCLYSPSDGIVLSGDHVLPTITPHISGLGAGEDPLDAFFASLDRMAELKGVELVLPAHGHPFHDLPGRCRDIHDHHVERLDILRAASAALGEASVIELSQQLFKPRSWGHMAESETFAHLEHLRMCGEMTSRQIDDELHFALVPDVVPARTSADEHT